MLNENQMAVVESIASNILCLAGAGTGKTHCMLERIRYLISEQDVDPRSMLVLTFTNAAACEMLYRYKVSVGAMHSIAMPTFNTFHAFCYNLIQTDIDILHDIGYSTIPDIVDDVQIKHVFQETVLLTGIKLSMDKMLHPVIARERADAKILTKAFFNALVKQNIITFDYLCLSVCNLFKKNSDIVRKYKDRYKYIFVDEYQDTDDIQHSFVMSFTDSNIFIVGDVLQSIYGFRGADSSIIKALVKDPKWTIYRLTENYRSTNSIIEYVNSFSKSYADESYRVELTADKIGVPVYIEVSSATSAYNYGRVELYILDKIIADYEIQTGSSAILARTNAEVKCITNYLKLNDISYTTNSSDEELINMVRSAISDDYAVMWLSSKLDSVKYTRFLKSTMMDDNYSLMNFRNLFGDYPEISDRLSTILELKETKSPEELFNMLNILINAKQLSVSNNELYVGTIHSVKGLEFDHVYVVDVNSVNFKLDTEENKNLYYVAITRARESLQVFAEAEN